MVAKSNKNKKTVSTKKFPKWLWLVFALVILVVGYFVMHNTEATLGTSGHVYCNAARSNCYLNPSNDYPFRTAALIVFRGTNPNGFLMLAPRGCTPSISQTYHHINPVSGIYKLNSAKMMTPWKCLR